MLAIAFDGWFQCRLATDPDAFDDGRGQQGWTFAMAGEPDLDRVIRFRDPVVPRSRGPTVGVVVREVSTNSGIAAGHPLIGAPVELLDDPVFEGRNGLIATSANEPIAPFSMRIAAAGLELVGTDPIDLNHPDEVFRRQPIDFDGNSNEVRQATAIPDAAAYRQQRRAALAADLTTETDSTKKAALQGRIDELQRGGIRITALGFKLSYGFELRGPNTWSDPGQVLGSRPAPAAVWKTSFWMGGWDADVLCGFVRGEFHVAD
jgi:hypothetical protein